jgi:hypothetical protein
MFPLASFEIEFILRKITETTNSVVQAASNP